MRRSLRVVALAVALAALAWLAATGFGDPTFDLNAEANARFAAGDIQGALERYRELQQRRPDLPEAHLNAGNAMHELEDHTSALVAYDRAIRLADARLRATAYYDRGNTLFRLERFDQARDAYVEALRLDPDDRDAKFNIEVIDRLKAERRQRQQQPPPGGGQQQPGGQQQDQRQQQGGQQQDQRQRQQPGRGAPQPGQPQQPGQQDPNAPSGPPPPDIIESLLELRRDLTLEDALRVLDALRGQERGVRTLLESEPRRGAPEPLY